MYSTQALKSTGRRGSESKGNYRMTHSLSMDDTRKTIPKTDNNIFSGIMNLFGSVGNIVSKIPNFMTSINNTLSVTVLPNSTITSEDLLRNLTGSTEHLSSDNKMFDSAQSNYTGLIANSITSKSQSHNQFIDQHIILQNTTDWIKQFQDSQSIDLDMAIIESLKTMKEHNNYSSEDNNKTIIDTMDTEKIVLLNEKICTDKLGVDETIIKMNVPDSQEEYVDTELLAKKSLVTKSRRKCNVIAKNRRKGKGKGQLRKSGVSQMKHRKERIKNNLYSNIQDDLDCWEGKDINDLPNNYNNDKINDRMSPIIDDESDLQTSYEIIPKYPDFSDTFVLDKSSKIKNWRDKKNHKPDMLYKIKIVSDKFEDIGTSVTCKLRPRLISECSIASDDLSIVFEDGSDLESADENETTSDYESSSEDDETETEEQSNCRVRFNLQPIVHTMVKWNYAYRAARRGPWEEMARDSHRFRERIHNVACTLDHVLTTQHRDRIWYERFSPQD